MNYKFNASEIEIKDLDDNNIVEMIESNEKKKLSQIVGNTVFNMADSIELSDKAREIHAGKAIVLDAQEKEQIVNIINQHLGYAPIVKRSIIQNMYPIDELETGMM